ncbi:MAG: hypothetical protein U0228_17020 [Myxococcaceae bacterium]
MISTLMVSLTLAAAPVVIQVDLQDALRFPSGVESPPAEPIVIFIEAPASWVKGGAISDAGKTAVLAKLYGGPQWVNGNDDGSQYVVKKFASKVLPAGTTPPQPRRSWWYVVKADGSLEKRSEGFAGPGAPNLPEPKSLVDQAIPGSVFNRGPKVSDSKALLAWLATQKGQLKLPAVLTRGDVGFSNRAVKVGGLSIHAQDAALGVSLADRAQSFCKDAATCEVWLFGTWKGKEGADLVFTVTKVESGTKVAELWDYAWHQAP